VAAFNLDPSLTNTVYIPDQLIAGNHDIVTDSVTIASGQKLVRGALIGQQTASEYGFTTAAQAVGGGANAGAETIGTVSVGTQVKLGTYRVNLTSTTAFNVLDPTGELVGTGTVGSAFTSSQVNLTVTTGSGIATNDGFNVVVEPIAGSGSGLYVLATGTATDGSQMPGNWLILAEDCDASATGFNANTNAPAYVVGEFDTNYITFGTGITAQGAKAALRQAGSPLYLKTGAVINSIL
jgi:hypothetical protein